MVAKRARKKLWQRRDVELSTKERKIKGKTLEALSLVRRERYSLTRAAREVRLAPKTIRRYTNAFRRVRGRWKAKKFDRIPRVMKIYEKGKLVIVEINDSRNASLIGEYHSLVGQALDKGDMSLLKKIRRKKFKDWKGRTRTLETKYEVIYELKQREAEPEFFEIYAELQQ